MTVKPTDVEQLALYDAEVQKIAGWPGWKGQIGNFHRLIWASLRGFHTWRLQITRDPPSRLAGQRWEFDIRIPVHDHEALSLWRDHARTWLEENSRDFEMHHSVGLRPHVFVRVGLRVSTHFYKDTIDAALIAAVVWVGERKGLDNV